MKILAIDIGGTHVKFLVNGQKEPVKIPSGKKMTAKKMMAETLKATKGWDYDVVSIGYPGPVVKGKPGADPKNLGKGWVGFDFKKAFGKPVKLINDAAMQALGSYHGGRMLFLGLGTGLGTTLIAENVVVPMELAHLPYKKGHEYEYFVGVAALERSGKKKWRKHVTQIVELLRAALQADYVVLGGGNARLLKKLPENTELGSNANAFKGGFRLWEEQKVSKEGYQHSE